MIDMDRLQRGELRREPFEWAAVERLYSEADARALVAEFPTDGFRTVKGYDGEKGYLYESRSLVHMGATVATRPERLGPSWRKLAADLLSPAYRAALSALTGVALGELPMEINVTHYGANAWLGPHLDLPDKIVTHVLYFNDVWPVDDGGCLHILRSSRMDDLAARVPPLVGTSAVLVRSERSWHAVSKVRPGVRTSRRSAVVTFYRPGSKSTMWPAGEKPQLHDYPRSRVGRLLDALRR